MKKFRKSISLILAALMILAYPGMAFAEGQGGVDAPAIGGEALSEPETDSETIASEESVEKVDSNKVEDEESTEIISEETAEVPSDDQTGKTEVTVVHSAEELAQNTSAADNEAFFSIDASKKKTSEELATEEVQAEVTDILSGGGKASQKQDKIIDVLEDSGFYSAEGGKGSKVEVTSTFAAQRLRLTAEKAEALEAYGAVNAVYYKDYYLLSYESEEATKLAYESLCEDYGEENVLVDIPVKAEAYGWGAGYMGFTTERAVAASGANVTIAVCDTGIKSNHKIFSHTDIVDSYNVLATDKSKYKNSEEGYRYTDPYNVDDDFGHGTAVAGIIAESTPSNVKIMPIKVLDYDGEGFMEDVFIGMEYAENHGADVINLSLGGEVRDGSMATIYTYDQQLSGYKALIVSAAGNGDENHQARNMDAKGINTIPAEMKNTVCVGAFDSYGGICSFSNYGKAVDFAAPGKGIKVAGISGGVYTGSGTSFACPYVAAAAGIIKAENSGLDKNDIENMLVASSNDMGEEGRDDCFGNGCPLFRNSNETLDINPSVTIIDTLFPYTGKEITPAVMVKNGDEILAKGKDYIVKYSKNINAGTAGVTVKCINGYNGSATASFSISKVGNGLNAWGKTVKVKKKKVRKKAQNLAAWQLMDVSGANGPVSYAKLGGSGKLKINSAGTVTVKKKTKKGKYKMTVRVTALGDNNHTPASRDVTVTVRVK